jgi:hypothetical protein
VHQRRDELEVAAVDVQLVLKLLRDPVSHNKQIKLEGESANRGAGRQPRSWNGPSGSQSHFGAKS